MTVLSEKKEDHEVEKRANRHIWKVFEVEKRGRNVVTIISKKKNIIK